MILHYRNGKVIRSFQIDHKGNVRAHRDRHFASISAAKRHSRTVCGLDKVANVDTLPSQPR